MSFKWPSEAQWQQFLKILTKREKISFFALLFFFLVSSTFLIVNFYLENTEIRPTKGGEFVEGVVGSPRFINPIFASASDVDRDLVELIFSGLMRYNSNGGLELDLAKDYEILDDGRTYQFNLKDGLFWQDGRPLTTEDIIFTIQTIQNADIKSPLWANWIGVEVEKISEKSLRFKLSNESAIFLENTTLKIIPKHIWDNVSVENFHLFTANLNPVGSGPYKMKNLFQNKDGEITSLELVPNPYYDRKPYLQKITFRFFDSEQNLIGAAKTGLISGFSASSTTGIDLTNVFNLYSFSLPRYFAVFFNLKNSKALSEKEVRQALNYGTNKEEILNEVFPNFSEVVQSPILPDIYNFKSPTSTYPFDAERAKEILEKAGFLMTESGVREKIIKKELAFQFKSNLSSGASGKEVEELQKCLAKDSQVYPEGEVTGYFGQKTKEAVIRFQEKYKEEILKPQGLEKGTGDVKGGTRDKLNEICFEKPEEKISLRFSLTTVNQSSLVKVANLLKKQWQELGVEIELKTFNSNTVEEREILRKRSFDMLLYGEVLGQIPDPFPFWHSSQKGEFGLNLSNYENKKVDKLLETARKSLDEKERQENLEEFQEILIEESPAVFLYAPDYLYFISKEIKGIDGKTIIDPSKRLSEIENWYVKTKRVLK